MARQDSSREAVHERGRDRRVVQGAYRSVDSERHLENIEKRILVAVTVLPYDVPVARVFGRIQADLARSGRGLPNADLQIAATAIRHGLELVTGNLRHFQRVPDLRVNPVLAETRSRADR